MVYQYYYILNKNEDKNMKLRYALNGLDIKYSDKGILLSFVVMKDNPAWEKVQKISEQMGCTIRISPIYSKNEFEKADFYILFIKDCFGYPEPKNPDKDQKTYIDYTYSRSNICTECGMGKNQVSPFYIKIAPNITKKRISTLYWVNDELFVSAELAEKMKKEKFEGVDFINVLSIEKGVPLEGIKQIKVREDFPEYLKFDSKKKDRCKKCGLQKYIMTNETIIECSLSIKNLAKGDFYRSKESFGDGAAADRLVIISKKVWNFLDKEKVGNFSIVPLFYQ